VHPPEETLLSFVSGEADLPARVVLEGHLDGCPDCRETVRSLRAPGARLFDSLGGEGGAPSGLWQRLERRVAALGPPARPEASPLAGYPVPAGAIRELADDSRVPHWRLIFGGRFAVLHRDRASGSMLILGRSRPARFVPRHRHVGSEEVLVLRGGFEDQYGHFEAGMYASYEAGTEHRPWIEDKEPCWMLARLEKPVEFTGWRGWVQKLVT